MTIWKQPWMGVPLWEWAGVAVVGLLAGTILRTVGFGGALLGAITYTLGYAVRGRRPEIGWDPRTYLALPAPVVPVAYLPPPVAPSGENPVG